MEQWLLMKFRVLIRKTGTILGNYINLPLHLISSSQLFISLPLLILLYTTMSMLHRPPLDLALSRHSQRIIHIGSNYGWAHNTS